MIQRPNERAATYIGDGVYVAIDQANQVWLRVDRGLDIHEIALERNVLARFVEYIAANKLLMVTPDVKLAVPRTDT